MNIKAKSLLPTEPKFQAELTKVELIQTLSWYAQNKDPKDAHKYASDYLKKKLKLSVDDSILKTRSSTFGFICRIITNGGTLNPTDSVWFDEELESIKQQAKNKKTPVVEDKPTSVPNIQDRIREKASECIGELEGQVDEMILSEFKTVPTPFATMNTLGIKSVHCRFIIDWAKKNRAFYELIYNGGEAILREAYSNFNKTRLKKFIAYFDQVILDCGKIGEVAKKTKKPRKVKVKTKDQIVGKMKFLDKFDELKLVSVSATDIIGAAQLWVYNTKTRKLGVYHAEHAGGLSVKGSTIMDFAESKSVQKTLRKPAEILPNVLKSGKVALKTILTDLKTAETTLTGRINGDTILLRTVK